MPTGMGGAGAAKHRGVNLMHTRVKRARMPCRRHVMAGLPGVAVSVCSCSWALASSATRLRAAAASASLPRCGKGQARDAHLLHQGDSPGAAKRLWFGVAHM